MEGSNEILDSEAVSQATPEIHLADAGSRFANMIIDSIIFYVLNLGFTALLGMNGSEVSVSQTLATIPLSWLLIFLYYFIMESTSGKTVGKMITKTRVVNQEGEKPTGSAIALRTLIRLIPFEAFSFLGKVPSGWHDTWSKTYVIKEKKA